MLVNGILRFLGIALGFVITIVIISELNKESAGVYFAAYANIMFVSTIMRLGMDDTLLKYSSLYYFGNNSKIVAHIVLFKFILIASLIYLILLLVFFFAQDTISALFGEAIFLTIKHLLVLPFFLAVINLLCIFFQGIGYVKISVVGLTVVNVFVSIIIIYFFEVKSPHILADIMVFATGIAVLFCLFWYFKIFGFIFFKRHHKDRYVNSFEIMDSCLPLWFVVISGQVFQWGAQVVGSQYLGPADLADIAISVRFSQLAVMILWF